MNVNVAGTYSVVPDRDVKLTIVVGDAQSGYSDVYLDNVRLTKGAVIGDFLVGKGKDLVGKTLTIDTQVTVVNPNTNHTSVTYKLNGGAEDKDFPGEATATNVGDTVDYHASFDFKA